MNIESFEKSLEYTEIRNDVFYFKKDLALTFALGSIAVVVAYGFDPLTAARLAVQSALSRSTFAIVAIFYTVTFLQKMMEAKGHIALAEGAVLGLTNSRRISAEAAPMCVGLMPGPGAVVLGGAMVNSICKDSLSNEDKNFITSYFRHIPESFAPTYGAVVIGCELTKIPVGSFILYMLPVAALAVALGHCMFMRRVPGETGLPAKQKKLPDLKNFLLSLWPVSFIIICVAVTRLEVSLVTIGTIVLYFFVNRFRLDEVRPFFRASFESKIILSTVCILIFKDYIMNTDAVETLPRLFAASPLPDYLVFSLIFFVGSAIVGSTAITAIGIPLAYAAMPEGGVALLVLLSAMGYAAMQVSISHICLFLCSAYFNVSVASLIKRTIPIITVFCIAVVAYYLLLVHGPGF